MLHMLTLLTISSAVLLSSPTHTQALFEAYVQKSQLQSQEDILLTLKLQADPQTELIWPSIDRSLGGLELLESKDLPSQTIAGTLVQWRQLRLRARKNGFYIIPSLTAQARLVDNEHPNGDNIPLRSEEITLEVSDSSQSVAESLRDLKTIESPYRLWPLIALTILLLLLLIFLVFWLTRKPHRQSFKNKTIKIVLPEQAHEEALMALSILRQSLQQADSYVLRKLYFRLSDTLKIYLEHRYLFNATDKTREEIIWSIEPLALSLEAFRLLKDLLRDTDQVKFANAPASSPALEKILTDSETFIHLTALVVPTQHPPASRQQQAAPPSPTTSRPGV